MILYSNRGILGLLIFVPVTKEMSFLEVAMARGN